MMVMVGRRVGSGGGRVKRGDWLRRRRRSSGGWLCGEVLSFEKKNLPWGDETVKEEITGRGGGLSRYVTMYLLESREEREQVHREEKSKYVPSTSFSIDIYIFCDNAPPSVRPDSTPFLRLIILP